MPSDIFIYTTCAWVEWGWRNKREERKGMIFYGTSVKYNEGLVIILEMLMLSSFYAGMDISLYTGPI